MWMLNFPKHATPVRFWLKKTSCQSVAISLVMTASIESELVILLKKNGCLVEVIEELGKAGCTKTALMAHWFEEAGEVRALLDETPKSQG